jgi:NADH-quinone oxidoreductase subunit L
VDFGDVFGKVEGANAAVLTTIGLLLLVGAAGKSAQIPLYVWLPDAMEGPTPVSALIHAATMVTAGVYMTARMWPVYERAPIALETIAWVGLGTAVYAALIGMAQTDIKKVYAYSTVSQLGYMFLAVGVGAYSAGVFHLVTHAFFKAVLFLGAGSVIHALAGEQDMRRMGGLRNKIPVTFWIMLAGAAAIAALPFTSGFYSKDEILLGTYEHSPLMFWIAVITAGITSFYVFRSIFLVFFGTYRGEAHPHESPWSMLGPLAVLALLSVGGGFIPVPHFLEPVFPQHELHHQPILVVIGSAAGIIGLVLAYIGYVLKPGLFEGLTQALFGLTFVFDRIYNALVIKPTVEGSRTVLWRGIDAGLIDGLVNGVAARARGAGSVLRLLQSGNIRSYAAWVLLGSVGALIMLGVAGGVR